MKEINGEILCHKKKENDYILFYKDKSYSFLSDKLELVVNKKIDWDEYKHLYGMRLKKKIINFNNERTTENTILHICSDTINNNNTDKKINALRTLCDMLKNSNSTEENTEEETVNSESVHEDTARSTTEEKIDIDDLRAKIRQAQTDMKEEKKRAPEEKKDPNNEEESSKSRFSDEFQNYFMHFLQNPNQFQRMVGQIKESIENTVDHFDPNSFINQRKPVKVQKFYQA